MKPKEAGLKAAWFQFKKHVSNTTVEALAHKYPGKIVHEDFDSPHYAAGYFGSGGGAAFVYPELVHPLTYIKTL